MGGCKGFPGLSSPQLNEVYSRGQFWVPAGGLTPGVTSPCTIETDEGDAVNYHTYTVAKFEDGVQQESFFEWGFKMDFVDIASINIKLAPLWYAKTTAAGPANVVQWAASVNNVLIGSDIDYASPSQVEMQQIVPATAYDLQTGTATEAEGAIALTVDGDTLSATNWNLLAFMVEREGQDADDTFLSDAFVMGIGVQWAVDFGNVSEWPGA